MIAGTPPLAVPVPVAVRALAAGEPVLPVWENELGGLTFVLGSGPGRRFVKWTPKASGIDLDREASRLAWAAAFTAVPRVLDVGADEAASWLVTAGLPGENAVSDRWRAEPARAVAAVGSGLRALHDALPVTGCPFSWSVPERLAEIHERASAGPPNPSRWNAVHQHLGVPGALGLLADAPPIDLAVVCHGDACAPNTLIDDDGRCSGHVDFGEMGVADRWADLAIATWSTQWNYGRGWEEPLLYAYGIDPDPDRTAYYRLLWDLGP